MITTKYDRYTQNARGFRPRRAAWATYCARGRASASSTRARIRRLVTWAALVDERHPRPSPSLPRLAFLETEGGDS
jgi:hypothetical protein